MLIELVHANGRYSAENNSHTPPRGINASSYYSSIGSILRHAAEAGATLLYRPNLTSFTYNILNDPRAIENTLATDPVMDELKGVQGLVVQADGIYSPDQRKNILQEDSLLRKCGRAIVIGAYVNVCVPAAAHNLSSRNPNHSVGIDSSLSVHAGYPLLRSEFGNIRDFSLRAELQK